MRRPLTPSRSETKLDNLICASSSNASKRFCNRTWLHRNWYLVRITVRHKRCSASGTKLRLSSSATSRFTRRSASAKSFLRPRGPRFDCACARCRRSRRRTSPFPLLARRLPVPFQRCPDRFPVLRRRLHHHFLDLLLEQPSRQRAQLRGAGAKRPPLKLVLAVALPLRTPPPPTCAYERQFLLSCKTSHAPSGGSGERAFSYLKQGHGLSPLPPRETTTPNYSLNTHAPDQTYIRPQLLHCAIDLTARRRYHLTLKSIFMGFRGPTALRDIHERQCMRHPRSKPRRAGKAVRRLTDWRASLALHFLLRAAPCATEGVRHGETTDHGRLTTNNPLLRHVDHEDFLLGHLLDGVTQALAAQA